MINRVMFALVIYFLCVDQTIFCMPRPEFVDPQGNVFIRVSNHSLRKLSNSKIDKHNLSMQFSFIVFLILSGPWWGPRV
jgi:hypothetical protein